MRLGIGHPGDKEAVHGYVLSNFTADERQHVALLFEAIAEHMAIFWQHSPAALMSKIALLRNASQPMPEKQSNA
jgi:PTH1 family peptidyl-tRNA hydrolase